MISYSFGRRHALFRVGVYVLRLKNVHSSKMLVIP
jgi:hypothetical protein